MGWLIELGFGGAVAPSLPLQSPSPSTRTESRSSAERARLNRARRPGRSRRRGHAESRTALRSTRTFEQTGPNRCGPSALQQRRRDTAAIHRRGTAPRTAAGTRWPRSSPPPTTGSDRAASRAHCSTSASTRSAASFPNSLTTKPDSARHCLTRVTKPDGPSPDQLTPRLGDLRVLQKVSRPPPATGAAHVPASSRELAPGWLPPL
jgi:hypothetical protein